jgi:hypothetical protein
VATAGEFSVVGQQLANADKNFTYELKAQVGTIRLSESTINISAGPAGIATIDSTASGSVHLEVQLVRSGHEPISDAGKQTFRSVLDYVISTGLDVPLGHMVVLGTAATKATGVALILTVKPELVRVGR